MSKSVMERPPVYRGPSKIPKFSPVKKPLPDIGMENGRQKPSRLMQLKVNYHDKIMREKEEKIVKMYEENQNRALERVNSKGMVRDFFRERREIENYNGPRTQIPTINQHFKQKRTEQRYGETDYFEKRKVPVDLRGGYTSKNTIGRDKSNPLAPIDRNYASPPITRKPQIHGRPRTKEDKKPKPKDEPIPRSAPPPHTNFELYGDATQSTSDDTPPPNLSQLKKLQKQKIKTNRSNMSPASQKNKMSDFQKFQMEQDEERKERLRKHSKHNRIQNDSDDEHIDEGDEDDLVSKQMELMEQIQRQKDELERMRMERQKEEEEERREMEKRKRREEERRQKAKEEEERDRHEEEDQRRKDEEQMKILARKRREEESQRRREVDSQMSTSRTNRTHYSGVPNRDRGNMEDDFIKSENSYRAAPTPPKHPKPVRVKRPTGNPKNKQPEYEREETPPREFKVDISMYIDAAKDNDAYESSKIKLVACTKCGRKFASDRVQRHMNSCDNLTKKRKILDPTKIRTTGTDMEKYNRNPKSRSKTPPKKKSNWRQQHESFMQNLRYAKKVTDMEKRGEDLSSLPPPPTTVNPDYVKCPNCSRTFNPTTAERHIPRCKAPPRKK